MDYLGIIGSPLSSNKLNINIMDIHPNQIYHIYNQGNNRGKIFFIRENYLYFLRKIQVHICPFADILAWCLMPNHFHLIVSIRSMTQIDQEYYRYDITYEEFNRLKFTNSLASMLRSYTRAINIQEKHTGALFRERTKAISLGSIEAEKLKSEERCIKGKEQMPDFNNEHLQTCFNYIHLNPVKANLVKQLTEWEFSSAREIWGIGNAKLVNKKMVEELGLQLDLVSG